MVIREISPMPVLFYKTETSLTEMHKLIGNVAKELYAEAARLTLQPISPIEWIYYGANGNPDTRFTLEIALPVEELPKGETKFDKKELPAFKAVTMLHEGAWPDLGQTYQKIFADIAAAGLKPVGVSREQYIRIDFKVGENNRTGVLVGVE